MADAAETPAKTDAAGRDAEDGVKANGNDAFTNAFDTFAAGSKPDPTPQGQTEAEDDDDDNAGPAGGGERGHEPPSTDADGERPAKPSGDKPAAGEQHPDPWANATPAQLAERDKLMRQVAGASGRASSLQRQINEMTRQQPGEKPAAKADSEKKPDAWTAMDDKMKQLREDYPEIAEPLIAIMEQQRDELAAVKGSMAPVIAADEQQVIAHAQNALTERHPDWADFAPGKNADFDGWVQSQPDTVQAMAESWDAREVAVALTLFKVERAEAIQNGGANPRTNTATDTKRQRQLDGGREVGSRPGGVATGAPDDFTGAFDHFAAKAKK